MIQQDKIKTRMCRSISKILHYSSQKGWRRGDQKNPLKNKHRCWNGDGCHWLNASKSNTEKTRGKRRRGQAEEFSGRRRENNITHTHI